MGDNKIKIPFSFKDCNGKQYELVISKFKDAGFTNVTTTTMEDIKVGLLKKEGQVEYASINGDAKFKRNKEYDKNATIRVVYHVKGN